MDPTRLDLATGSPRLRSVWVAREQRAGPLYWATSPIPLVLYDPDASCPSSAIR